MGKTGDSYKDSVHMYYASICIWHCIISVSFRFPFRSVPRFSNTITETAPGKHGHADVVAVLPKIKFQSQCSIAAQDAARRLTVAKRLM